MHPIAPLEQKEPKTITEKGYKLIALSSLTTSI